jgi:N-succinyl-L-ornithine transcarbamylase
MRHFTSINDVPDVNALIKRALELRLLGGAVQPQQQTAKGKTLVLLFFNPSLRTRLSTEKAAQNLGMQVISIDAASGWKIEFEDQVVMNLDRAEHIREAAGVIGQYADIIGIRTFPTLTDVHRDYEELVLRQFQRYTGVPVISLESATLHPLQSLADAMTIAQHSKGVKPKVVLTWAPHVRALPQAVPNSFLEWLRTQEVELVLSHPKGAELSPRFTEGVRVEYDQLKALEGADFVYAKNWSSYLDYGRILSPMEDWMVTEQKMSLTNEGKFMHCLPVRRNVVVTDEVLDGDRSLVMEQVKNREFGAQAVLEMML